MASESNKKYFIQIESVDDYPTEEEISVAIDEIIEDVKKEKLLKEDEVRDDLVDTIEKKCSSKNKKESKNKKFLANVAFVMLLGLGAIIVAYVYALLVVVEGEVNRASIIAEIEKATGRKMNVNSRITFESFPVPKFIVNGISIKNKDQSVNENFMEISSLEVHPSLLYLVLGSIKISDLNFINTTINIENFISSGKNWGLGEQKSTDKKQYTLLNSITVLKDYFNINKIGIKNLNINLYSGKKENPIMRNINLSNISFIANSVKGPYKIQGNVYARKAEVNFDYLVDIGEIEQIEEIPISLKISSKTTELNFIGSIKEKGDGFEYKGDLNGTLDDSVQYMRKYISQENNVLSDIVSGILVDEGVSISSKFKLTNSKFILRNFVFNDKGLDGVSDAEIIFGRVSKVNVRLKYKSVDIDSIIEKSGKAEILSRKDKFLNKEGDKNQKKYKITDIGLPDDINIRIKADINKIKYKNKILKKLKLDMRAGSYMAINKIEIFSFPGGGNLRGGGKVSNTPNGPRFDGKLKLAVKDLKDLMNWYNSSKESKLNNNKVYRDFYLNSNVTIESDKIILPNLSLGIDGSKINGRMTLKRNNKLIVNSSLTVTDLDLNKYKLFQNDNNEDLNSGYIIFEFLRSVDNIFENLTLNLNAQKISFAGKKYNDFSTVASFGGGISEFSGISYDIDGEKVKGNIKLDNRRLNPEINVVFDMDKVNKEQLLSVITRGNVTEELENPYLSSKEFTFSDLNILRGNIRLNIKELQYGKLENDKLEKIKISMRLEKDLLKIINISAKAFKGNLRFIGDVNIGGSRRGARLNYYITNIEFRDFLSNLFSISNIGGRINSNGQISVSGNTLGQWVRTMTGAGQLVSRGITLHGFDTDYLLSTLPKLKKSVRQARFTVHKALSTGKMKINFLSGGYQFYKGKIILTKGYRISSPSIMNFAVNGDIDLVNWLINVSMRYSASSRGGKRGYPIALQLSGSLDFPRAIWNQKTIVKTWEESQY